jgi:hypothetical protein
MPFLPLKLVKTPAALRNSANAMLSASVASWASLNVWSSVSTATPSWSAWLHTVMLKGAPGESTPVE